MNYMNESRLSYIFLMPAKVSSLFEKYGFFESAKRWNLNLIKSRRPLMFYRLITPKHCGKFIEKLLHWSPIFSKIAGPDNVRITQKLEI